MTYFTFLTIFYLKMNICQNLNLSYTYDHQLENMITIKFFIWFTNLFHSYGITIFNRYYKIHKAQRLFQSFLEYIYIYIYIYICCDILFFYINIFFTSSYEKNLWKSFDIIMIWLKFKPCTPTKQCNVLCDNNFDSLIFYPQLVVLNVFLTLPNVPQHFLFYLMASHFSSLVQCFIIPQYPPIVCDFFP